MVTGKLERGTIVTGSACDVLGMDERKKATVAGQCADSVLASPCTCLRSAGANTLQ